MEFALLIAPYLAGQLIVCGALFCCVFGNLQQIRLKVDRIELFSAAAATAPRLNQMRNPIRNGGPPVARSAPRL